MWLQMTAKNDWGANSYYLGDTKVHPDAFQDKALIKWPNDTEESITLQFRSVSGSVMDMGAPYYYRYSEPYLIVQHHGATAEINPVYSGIRFWRKDD